MPNNDIKLTSFSKGAGCGCKIAPDTLQQILGGTLEKFNNPDLLVGNEANDDAAVLNMGNGIGLISTTDFFSPIVDDPFDFGRIAAVNALSDIYAMGGSPNMALAILGWPLDKLSPEIAQNVLNGGIHACNEAGISLAGGHSIDVPEPIFGLAVNGTVKIENLKQNNGAKVGDKLFLTKPLGVGILSTAMKRSVIEEADANIALDTMSKLNSIGANLATIKGVNAMTDVTGFGLIGHLLELCEASGVTAELKREKIPVLPCAKKYLAKGCYPDGTFRNWRSYGSSTSGCEGNDMLLFSDPQTSGGLLISVAEEGEDAVKNCLRKAGIEAESIGNMTPFSSKKNECLRVS